jgi:hypothetical protein
LCALAKVELASGKGYIFGGAMREWALGLCRSNEVAFDTSIETSGPRFAYLLKPVVPSGPPPKHLRGALAESKLEAAVCAQLGLKSGALTD